MYVWQESLMKQDVLRPGRNSSFTGLGISSDSKENAECRRPQNVGEIGWQSLLTRAESV